MITLSGIAPFPVETLVVQHRLTADYVPYFEEEKVFLAPCVDSDPKIFEGVSLRLPDIVFDDYLRIDLSDRQVELHYFGPANTLGDTITYVPEAKVAWTGNLTGGIFGLALESDASTFLETLTHFVQTFSIKMLIPAHRPPAEANLLGEYLVYFSEVTAGVKIAVNSGWSLEKTLERVVQSETFSLPPENPMANAMTGRHRYNVQKTYMALKTG